METLNDLAVGLLKVREAINSIEIKGSQNASLVVYANRKCTELLDQIDAMMKRQNGNSDTEGEADIEQH